MKIPNATEEAPVEPESHTSNASPHAGGTRRRSHHGHGHGHTSGTGKKLVLLMVFVVLLNAGLRTYLAITGQVHPLFENMSYVTRLVINGLFTAVLLLCLFRVYRGSLSVRQLFGGCAALVGLCMAVSISWSVMEEALPPMWIALDGFAMILAVFSAWICYFSSSAARFFSHQNHKD